MYAIRSYYDVAIIETEMVNTAKWISENTTEDAKIAAHDIGALGFFGNRAIIDLAGLISPEVIPFMDDEHQLAEFLIFENPDYLIRITSYNVCYTKLLRVKAGGAARTGPSVWARARSVYEI